MIAHALAGAALMLGAPADAAWPALNEALETLAQDRKFSGAVVVQGAEGIRFARGYGPADPFTGRPFTPDTPADSGSLAKPVTAAAVLMLARDGRIDLDAPVRRYLPEFPHPSTSVRHLLAHSAGLPFNDSPEALAGKDNAALLAEVGAHQKSLFPPGSAFAYCNLCYVALAEIVERVTGRTYLAVVRDLVTLPAGVALRPLKLSDWHRRALGYRISDQKIERFDSWEGEAFYGPANLSISARQLAGWGTEWWRQPLASIRDTATAPATVAGSHSGLTLGNWYCAPGGRRCHYLGHHQGFHHMLYWDSERRISVAMLTNNALAPSLQQRVQRALVAFAEDRPADARRELATPLPEVGATPGSYSLPTGECVVLTARNGGVAIERGGLSYPAYPTSSAIRYVPGLDAYLAGYSDGRLLLLTLYEDVAATPARHPCTNPRTS